MTSADCRETVQIEVGSDYQGRARHSRVCVKRPGREGKGRWLMMMREKVQVVELVMRVCESERPLPRHARPRANHTEQATFKHKESASRHATTRKTENNREEMRPRLAHRCGLVCTERRGRHKSSWMSRSACPLQAPRCNGAPGLRTPPVRPS
eukprot:3600759-Rhodomonas_salina.3